MLSALSMMMLRGQKKQQWSKGGKGSRILMLSALSMMMSRGQKKQQWSKGGKGSRILKFRTLTESLRILGKREADMTARQRPV